MSPPSSSCAPLPPPSSSPPSSILHLYAELLLHIRTVTFSASLSPRADDRHTTTSDPNTPPKSDHSGSERHTRAELSPDGASITLVHAGERASLRLPARVIVPPGGAATALTLPGGPAGAEKEVALRLRVGEASSLGSPGSGENVVPWDAGRLEAAVAGLGCRGCGASVVDDDGVKRWMDLPNENWAEMMDFWHCHKPHENGAVVSEDKGYAASNRVMAKRGVGYVDLAYLLLAEGDCKGVQPSSPASSNNATNGRQHIICSSCKNIVGVTDPRAEGWRLWKWSLAATTTPKGDSTTMTTTPTTQTKTYSTRKWIAAQLLYLIENQGVRKFTVTAESEPEKGEEGDGGDEADRSSATAAAEARDPIMIWVFTPDLSFSSSVASSSPSSASELPRNDPTRAMKVLWKPADPAANNGGGGTAVAAAATGQALDRQSLSTEDLSLPPPAFDALTGALRESGAWLPASARAFREWNVGLLERFGDDEV